MQTIKRAVAAAELLLIFPAVLFLSAVFLPRLQPVEAEPARTAQHIVLWYAERQWTLWLLLIALPVVVLFAGCATLLRDGNGLQTAVNARPLTLLIATVTVTFSDRLHGAAIDMRRQVESAEMRRLLGILDDLRDRLKSPDGYRSQETENAEDAFLKQGHRAMGLERVVPDPTALLVIDEADRLKIAGLEQTRSIFDHGGIGMILIGMPGLEKRLARYPQFYSRIGFVHEFRPLSASEIRQLLERHWTPPGVKLPGGTIDTVAAASIIRITGGNFRLLNRLLTQVERILEINALPSVTKEAVEAARENLVIGQA